MSFQLILYSLEQQSDTASNVVCVRDVSKVKCQSQRKITNQNVFLNVSSCLFIFLSLSLFKQKLTKL